jgi:hypothetical protein
MRRRYHPIAATCHRELGKAEHLPTDVRLQSDLG